MSPTQHDEFFKKRREHLKQLLLSKSKEEIVDVALYYSGVAVNLEQYVPAQLYYSVVSQIIDMVGEDAALRVHNIMTEAVESARREVPRSQVN